MLTTVASYGAEDTTDGDLIVGRGDDVDADSLAVDVESSGPVPLDLSPYWRWLARKRMRRGAVAVLLLEVALIVGFVAVYKPFDLNIYLWGGDAVTHGLRLYLVQADANWFTYPPFAATLFAPMAGLPAVVARLAWELVSLAALAWAGALTVRLAGYRPTRPVIIAMTAAAVVLEPVYHTLYLGQVNLFLMALVLADLRRISRGRPAGIGIGVAAAVKLVPGIFIGLLLLTRRFRDAAIAAGTFVCCGQIGYLVNPSASKLYWTRLFFDTKRVSDGYISNQSLYAAVVRVLGGPSHARTWFLFVALAIGTAGLVVAAVLARRGDWLGAAAVTGVTGLIASPISWTHHWIWVVPALVVLLRGGAGARITAACGYALFALAPMWWTPHPARPGMAQTGFHGLTTLTANCFLVAGFGFLTYMAVVAWRSRTASRLLPPEWLADELTVDDELLLEPRLAHV
jgi:alpha-1,2-mannosyltransferase